VVATLLADPEAAGVIAATPVTDTIKCVDEPRLSDSPPLEGVNRSVSVRATVDRRKLWAAQTPQIFRAEELRAALAGDPSRVAAATDEAMLVEASGGKVLIHPSPPENLKVTTLLDLKMAELLLH